ncbi:MAG: hypothetical protein UHG91_01855 [Succinivibrionaceae bacterium]|nr:hypothetical protein [Ruminobacter sp.]MEE1339510.1 hypothetical protein [Succinivibrionaceae bacterium]
MSDIDLVIECCKKLSQEGKKPTSALIKYRLNSKVSFPTIIQGIQNWRQLSEEEQSDFNKESFDESLSELSDDKEFKTLSDEEFLKLESSKQLLYIKHLLENVINKKED